MPYQNYQSRPLNLRPAPTPQNPDMQSNSYLQGLQQMKDIQARMAQRQNQQAATQGTSAGQGAYAASNQPFGQRGPVTPGAPQPATGSQAFRGQPLGGPTPSTPQSPPPAIANYMAQNRAAQSFGGPSAQTPGQFAGGYGQTPDLLAQRRGAMGASMGASQGAGYLGRQAGPQPLPSTWGTGNIGARRF